MGGAGVSASLRPRWVGICTSFQDAGFWILDTAYWIPDTGCGIWVRLVVWVRAELGLIGFVFLSGAGQNIGVTLCNTRGCGSFGVLGIGFVLHKKSDL